MATTTGAVPLARTEPPQAKATGSPGRARRRLLSVVDQVAAYAWGRRPLPVPPPSPDAAPAGERRLTQLERIAGPVGPVAPAAPLRPAPVDKHSTLAHYQAMAEQLAYERRLAAVNARRPTTLVGREVWFTHPGRRAQGARPHG